VNRWREPLLLVVALALLHAAAAAPIVWSWPRFTNDVQRLVPDLFVLVALVLCLGAAGRPRTAAVLAAIAMLAWSGFRAVLVLLPKNLDREFEFTDFARLPALWHLHLHDQSTGGQVATVALWVLQLAVAFAVALWCFLRIARAGTQPRRALVLAAVLQALAVATVLRASWSPDVASAWHPSTAVVVAQKAWTALENVVDPSIVDTPILANLAEGRDRMQRAPKDLGKLAGTDVHFLIVESYGRVAQTAPELAPRLRRVYDELLPQLRAAKFDVSSSTCYPAISGGESWLAHAQLWSASRIQNQRAWHLLLASDALALPKVFANAGYRTVDVAPAMDRHWPEGMAFYGFTDEVTQLELDYRGTRYHFGHMPDQHALHHLLVHFVEPPRDRPLFTSFVSVTNHVPFRFVPPYIADWRLDAGTFAGPPRVDHGTDFDSVAHTDRILPAFADTLEYSLRTIVGFVTRLQRPSLIFVLGDHQPPFCGFLDPPDRSGAVIVHAISNRPELLAPLADVQFTPGFEVPATTYPHDSSLLAPSLLHIYSGAR